jgi:hypothetical protein
MDATDRAGELTSAATTELNAYWNAACRLAFSALDLSLRPGITMEKFARALAVLADGVALQTTSTSGHLDDPGESDASLLAELTMMLLVGAIDADKTGVSLTDAVNALIEPAYRSTDAGD